MIKYAGFESKKMEHNNEKLPAGGYVARIINAEVVTVGETQPIKKLRVSFDIAEGEYKGIFRRKYESSNFSDKKWKGVYTCTVPDPDNRFFESQNRVFGNFIYSVERSNPSYIWNWDEATLTGKAIGVLFGEREYDFNGYHGMATECYGVCEIEDIRSGNFVIREPRRLANKPAAPAGGGTPAPYDGGFEFAPIDDADCPF